MSQPNLAQPPSSSSVFVPDRTVPDRTGSKKNEEEDSFALARLMASLPVDKPSAFCQRYATEAAVLTALQAMEMPLPDALDLLNSYGVAACEGAILRTLAYAQNQDIRRPRGWLITTLRRGVGWTPAQVVLYVRSEWERCLRKMEDSGNPQQEKWALEIRLKLGSGPENVVKMERTA